MIEEISQNGFTVKCMDGAEGMLALPDKSIKLVYGSPPYPNAERDYGVWRAAEYIDKISPFIDAAKLKLRDDGFIVINVKANREKTTSRLASKRSLIVEKLAILLEERWGFHCVDIETIIWGNNGRGKTTLLNIFRYALFGRYKNRRGTDVDLITLPNIEGRSEGNYSFKVVLRMINDDTRYELTRQCKVRQGVTVPKSNDDFESYVFLKENGSLLSPDARAHVLKVIMPDEVSRFFLFDGELLQEYEELLLEGTEVGSKIKDHCQLCDQDLDEARVQMLLEKVATYTRGSGALSVDEATELQRLRVRKATLESMRSGGNMELLSLLEGQLDSLAVEIDDSERQLRAVREELERHGDVEKLAKSSRDAVTALAQCLKKIENLKEGIQAVKNKLKEIDGALATLEDKMNRVSTDADMLLAGRKVSMCEQIHDIFESGIAAYRDKLKTDVERDATELFVGISNDPDYIQLKINDNYGLSMVHASGELVPLRSAGFEHVVALSLIGALHKNAPLRGPIIMDSPFGRLDPDHKRNITQALPSMSEQIVLLAYTHEIDEQQTRETLADALKKEYRLTRYSSFHTEIEPQ